MKNAEHNQKPIFLETTIQIGRIIGNQAERDRIRCNINGQRLYTSGHVLAEFNRTLLKDAITFRNILLTSPDFGESVKRFGKYSRTRKFPRLIFLLATFNFDNDKESLLARLEMHIEWKLHDLFWESIDRNCFVDGVKCAHRQWQAEQNETGDYDLDGLRCLKASPLTCDLMSFIQINRSALEEFINAPHTRPRNNVRKATQLFEAILNGIESPFGIQNCCTISDVLIVLEAPSEAAVYSTDADVHAICEILGKFKYSETSSIS